MSLNPITATEEIEKRYLQYLSTTFYINDTNLRGNFIQELSQKNRFIKGPILEATPPFKKGKSINQLISEGILSHEFKKLSSPDLPVDRELYLHQERGIRKIITEERNIIAATGTGSGKTEIFMIPILNYLFTQKEKTGELSPGVRALLLYPMNALANDQLKRLRNLLCNYPDITFGSYTGETEETEEEAQDKYRKIFNGAEPLNNEILSRQKMREKPPHILITNYAMLEYLLLRPDDNDFFDGPYAGNWKYIVLDEIHTYTGAKGIEMSMLLRRLKERVVTDKSPKIRFIGTSATIGRGKKDFNKVAEFGEKLFGEEVFWDDFDERKQDIVHGERLPVEISKESWGKPDANLYEKLITIIETFGKTNAEDLLETAKKHQVPEQVINGAKEKNNKDDYHGVLYEILKGDQRIIELQKHLETGPCFLNETAMKIFPLEKNSHDKLVSLIQLANMAFPENGYRPLLPARYHLFVRAIEGAYLTLFPEVTIFLDKREHFTLNNRQYPVFEIATCRNCGELYLVGRTITGDMNRKVLKQHGRLQFDEDTSLEYYLLISDNQVNEIINEDELALGYQFDEHDDKYNLCGMCGTIDKENLVGEMCSCGEENYVKLLKVKSKEGMVHKCPACGSVHPHGSLVWRFLLGIDSVTSVLATALYQQGTDIKITISEEQSLIEDDGWGTISAEDIFICESETQKIKGGQLLVFSDSRQDAAFFATYLKTSYMQILHRRMIIKTLEKNKEKVISNRWRLVDLVNHLKKYLEETELFPDKSPQQLEDEAWKWVLYEFFALDRRNGLEGLGLLGFSLTKPKVNFRNPFMHAPWDLTFEESWMLFQILMDSFRKSLAVLFPPNISPQDEFFAPRNREYFFKQKSDKSGIFGWSPNRGINSRLDYLMRLAKNGLNLDISEKECAQLLDDIWSKGLRLDNPQSIFYDYFSSEHNSLEGTLYRVRTDYWELKPGIIDKTVTWYYCPLCHRLTLYNIKDVCPTFRCSGKLEKCNPDELFKNNHYRSLYLSVLPMWMETSEHTAQLTTEAAAEIQQGFNDGRINVLSCSTTFELGVDVGELETVFLRNVPPSPANYIQRAGRAGRRKKSSAFILTFSQRKSHDLTYYNNPERLILGEIKPPYFELKNEKIISRHIFSIAFSKFWREHKNYFGSVKDFFYNYEDGVKLFREFLMDHPKDLLASIKTVVPKHMHKQLEIDEWGWVKKLVDNEKGLLTWAQTELIDDVKQLEKMRDYYQNRRLYLKANQMHKTINTLKNRNLINFLAQKNVLPKYGFPVDVVNLQIYHHGEEAKKLDLDRDMPLALSEYAPGSQVIAGGLIWTSRYLKKLPNRELVKRNYAICDYCGKYESLLHDDQQKIDTCSACGSKIGRNKGTFVIPEFGFISEPPKPPTMERPRKTYTTRKYYAESGTEDTRLNVDYNGIHAELISMANGKLAIINHARYKGFRLCHKCGYAVVGNSNQNFTPHMNPFGDKCNGSWERLALGFEFHTDILQIRFTNYHRHEEGFWLSVLYGILEGVSYSMEIERTDIDGCLYAYSGDPTSPALVLFDNVPGGAGHVKRIIHENNLEEVLKATLEIVSGCNCGEKEGGTSCYGCLRNYSNQFCHDILDRNKVKEFIEELLSH
ncbi:MAG: DEAD/DEAH box helicase [Clostridiaceae bacterium]|jgi:ATP-dependent helicase YprA (DUF1998 family)|nr:DEAD/DEAH box helicase [Clostridiaceae bacterium]